MIFSIIVPIYNVEKYLRCCVDSVLAENFADYEMILVDDGSPDGCGKICDEYAGKYPHIKVIHQENGGLSDARNAGIRAAKGDYLIFLDSDDYWADTNRSKNARGGGFSLIYNNLQTKRLRGAVLYRQRVDKNRQAGNNHQKQSVFPKRIHSRGFPVQFEIGAFYQDFCLLR